MTDKSFTLLEDRGVIRVGGGDRCGFLQGLVSNDVEKATEHRAIHAALLTPQGKYLYDFFIFGMNDALMFDCEAAERLGSLLKRLGMYKLRSDVELSDVSDQFSCFAMFGDGAAQALGLEDQAGSAAAFAGGVAYIDPRLGDAGARAILPRDGAEKALNGIGFKAVPFAEYDCHRIRLGLTEGSRDLKVEKAILLENGFDEWGSADWDKGCYLGQELTARTKYRGLIRKRLMPVTIDGPAPASGTPLLLDGKEAGEMRSSCGNAGLAIIRLEHMTGESVSFAAGDASLTASKPDWMSFQDQDDG